MTEAHRIHSHWHRHYRCSSDGSSLNTAFGESIAMSKDGTTLIIGAPGVDRQQHIQTLVQSTTTNGMLMIQQTRTHYNRL